MWIVGLPEQSGKYWGYCQHDGDMMEVELRVHEDHDTLHNMSGACIGSFGPPPFIPPHLISIFTHFLSWSPEKPKPPRTYET
jgi:hypothetical protein